MSEDQKEPLDFIDFSHATTAAGYDQEDRGWSKMAHLEAEQEALRQHLSAALCLHCTRQDWPTLSDAVQDASGVIRANRKTLDELHQILGTEPHESILDRAREVATALAEKEARIGELEVALARTENGLAVARGIAEAYEPALAAAHEALRAVSDSRFPRQTEAEAVTTLAQVDSALSAPALQSVAKLDRLRREVCEAVKVANSYDVCLHCVPDCDEREDDVCVCGIQPLRKALAALRAEEEKNA